MKQAYWVGLSGVLVILAIAGTVRLGIIPVNADGSPSFLEARVFPMVLHASVARGAKQIRSRPLVDEDVPAGRDIYASLCAECHGRLDGRPGLLGLSLYPPAPQFSAHPSSYTSSELFWVIKHGIRDTGMPAWGNRLSDQDIWNVAAFAKSMGNVRGRD
jgi:mono/diheme cytochrome c family protein